MSNPVIQLKDVSYRYPVGEEWVLRNISLDIEKGKLVTVVGNNSSGKTTLCNLIRGFIPHFYKGELEGSVLVNGTEVADAQLGLLAEQIGYVFQNPFIQISGVKETVFDEVAFGLENLGVPVDEIRRRVEDVLALVKIDGLRDKNPFELSGGQRQRVALASIIVMDPDILVIDEPSSQLDPVGTEQVFEIIRLMKERGKTIVLVEHKMNLIAEYADELIVLNDGELVLHGPVREVFSDPAYRACNIQYPHAAALALELADMGMELPFLPIRDEEIAACLQAAGRKGGIR